MLKKPDLNSLNLPTQSAKDRLVKVWAIIDQAKWLEDGVKVISKLTEEIPENKGNVSAYLGGKRSISDNFYNTFIEKYAGSIKSTKSDDIALLQVQVIELTRALAKLNEIVTKESALDFYLAFEKRMKAELIARSNAS